MIRTLTVQHAQKFACRQHGDTQIIAAKCGRDVPAAEIGGLTAPILRPTAAQHPTFFRIEVLFALQVLSPGGGCFSRLACLADEKQPPRRSGKQLRAKLLNDRVDLFGQTASLQQVIHFVHQVGFAVALLQTIYHGG